MTIKSTISTHLKRNNTIHTGIKICIECGSILVKNNDDKIICTECGSDKSFIK